MVDATSIEDFSSIFVAFVAYYGNVLLCVNKRNFNTLIDLVLLSRSVIVLLLCRGNVTVIK